MFIATFSFLLVMLWLTVAVSYVNLGPLNNVVAMTIAVAKMMAVILYFMGVKAGSKLVWFWAAAGFIWFLLMFFTLGDYMFRPNVVGW